MKHLFNTPKDVMAFYAADDSGMAAQPRKGSTIKQEDRVDYWQASISQKFFSGQSMWTMSETFVSIMQRDLEKLPIDNDWVEIPDLYHFLQQHVARSTIETIIGPSILEYYPSLPEDFWEFDHYIPSFTKCIPRIFMPSAFDVRKRLLEKIKCWQRNFLSETGLSNPDEMDPSSANAPVSSLMKAREHTYRKMHFMNEDSRASETLGLIFASNSNAIRALFWFISEALKDIDLQSCLLSEAFESFEGDSIDLSKLSRQPLLQSTYAEILRQRVAIAISRMSNTADFHMENYTITKKLPMLFFSQMFAFSKEAWAIRPKTLTRPLEEFWARRFIVPSEKETTDGKGSVEHKASDILENSSKSHGTCNMDDLDGCWLPYGGGQRMCPGRHFAKHQILGTFALLFRKFEWQLLDDNQAKSIKPDLRCVPTGTLPPLGKLAVRVRRRQDLGSVGCSNHAHLGH
ncbi:MAG: hypothetical protein Q9227_001459 [Pyrenula ochraceoflavens]